MKVFLYLLYVKKKTKKRSEEKRKYLKHCPCKEREKLQNFQNTILEKVTKFFGGFK